MCAKLGSKFEVPRRNIEKAVWTHWIRNTRIIDEAKRVNIRRIAR